MEETPRVDGTDDHESSERWSGAISYAAAVCLLPYFLLSDRPFVLFHAKQGLLLFLLELVGGLVIWILDITIGRIPFLGILVVGLLQLVFLLLALALSVLGFTRALSGERVPLPWLGPYAEQLPDPPKLGRG